MTNKTDLRARAKVVRSMDIMARCINDENILMSWLMCGVADEDIKSDTTDDEIISMGYTHDNTFCELLSLFLRVMKRASEDGGLFVDMQGWSDKTRKEN